MTVTQVAGLLKELYSKEDVVFETLEKNPLLGVMPKDENLGGNEFDNFLVYGGAASGSGDFPTSQTNTSAPPTVSFKMPIGQDYCTPRIANKLIRQAKGGGEKAFIDALDLTMKAALAELGYSLCNTLITDGTGRRGYVAASSNLAGGLVTLTDPEQIVGFQQNMWVQFATQNGSTWSLENSGTAYQIVGMDETNGILNFGSTTNLSSVTQGGDTILRAGDMYTGTTYNNGLGNSAANPLFGGIGGWIPLTPPQPNTGDSWGGIDRSQSTTRLAGVRFDGRSYTPIQALNMLCSRIERQGGEPDYVVVNHFNFEKLASTIQGQARYDDVEAWDDARIRYKMLTLTVGGRDIRLVKDRTLSSDRGYVLTLKSWCLRSAGPLLGGLLDYPLYGEGVIPISNYDGLELRYGVYPMLSCNAPAYNGVVQFQ
jgi:hypothetical protein